jgi:hypothetical protein
MPKIDNITVKLISASNIQTNDVTGASDQLARATAQWGQALAANKSCQSVPSTQVGTAYNNLKVVSNACTSNITVQQIDAVNMQSNKVLLANTQKAISQTLGYDPAKNCSSQYASNGQTGSAYNNLNILA